MIAYEVYRCASDRIRQLSTEIDTAGHVQTRFISHAIAQIRRGKLITLN